MPYPFVDLPRGLTGALGVREYGQLPRQLADDVGLTVESLEMFLFNRRETVQSTEGALTIGFTASATVLVPPGEAWYVWGVNAAVTTAVGEAATFATAVRIGGAGLIISPYVTIGASTSGNAAPTLSWGRWLASGESVGIQATAVTGAPVKGFTAIVTRCRL